MVNQCRGGIRLNDAPGATITIQRNKSMKSHFPPVSIGSNSLQGILLPLFLLLFGMNTATAQGLSAPTGVKASDGLYPTMIEVEWDDPYYSSDFEVWRGTTANLSSAEYQSTEWWNWYMDYGVPPGQVYYYWIRAVSGSLTSAFSAPDSGYASQADTNRWRLTVNAGNHGRVMKNSSEETFSTGSMLILTAIADTGYKFTGWSGDATGTDNPLTFYITSNMVVNAAFELTSQPGGSITIFIRPEAVVTAGAKWKLQDELVWRDAGTTFHTEVFKTYTVQFLWVSGWVSPPAKEITIAQSMPNISWTVDYTQGGQGFTLTLQYEHGSIQKNPDTPTYQAGSSVILTAMPDNGYKFSYWSGDLQGSQNPATLTMQANKTVRAVFEPNTIPGGDVTVTQFCSGYNSPGTATITGKINYPTNKNLLSLKWTSQLPADWQISNVSGNGSPEIQQGEIVWTGTLTDNPVTVTINATVPAAQTGEKAIHSSIEYQLTGMINPGQVAAAPDPLNVAAISFHNADFRDLRWIIDGTEMNRVLSYWRAGGYHPESLGADGYAAGVGATTGNRHSADYRETFWVLDGTEVNRVLSYWRAGAYHVEALGADGYAAGPKPAAIVLTRSLNTVLGLLQTGGLEAQHSGPAQYTAGGTIRMTNQLAYADTLWSLLWRVNLPEGWQLLSVEGEGNPEKQGSEVLWTGAIPPSPIRWAYILQASPSSQGSQSIRAEVEYQLAGDVNPSSLFAQPDPFVLSGSGSSDPSIEIHLHAGILVNGLAGHRYQVEVSTNAADPYSWSAICNLMLTNTCQRWFDPDPAHDVKKFYRVKETP